MNTESAVGVAGSGRRYVAPPRRTRSCRISACVELSCWSGRSPALSNSGMILPASTLPSSWLDFVHVDERLSGKGQSVGEAVEEDTGDFDDLIG